MKRPVLKVQTEKGFINLAEILNGLQNWVRDKAYRPLLKRIEALEAEVPSLRQEKSELKYCGTFQRALSYKRNNIVTHDGSAWIKIADGKDGAPGACESWQLLVKRGRDAR